MEEPIKKKRGRKKKSDCLEQIVREEPSINIIMTIEENEQPVNETVLKKRGRKPKGGKLIIKPSEKVETTKAISNVILHLKCSLKDLKTNASSNYNLESFNFDLNKQNFAYEIVNPCANKNTTTANIINDINNSIDEEDDDLSEDNLNKQQKEVWKKLKTLQYNLHVNNISDKKSACFWCTYEFDNSPIYIPKHVIKDTYNVYGCFCSPECATAYLIEENIDSSTKFERYHLLNHVYCKIYDYKKNIKPAPNPYYMLDKYYGNLTIQEYRSLLRNERLFLVVDKPLTRILPELHDDNDDFIINNKVIASNTYQIKKKLQKNKTKLIF